MSKNSRRKTEKSKCISFQSPVCISYGQIESECKVIDSAAVSLCKSLKAEKEN